MDPGTRSMFPNLPCTDHSESCYVRDRSIGFDFSGRHWRFGITRVNRVGNQKQNPKFSRSSKQRGLSALDPPRERSVGRPVVNRGSYECRSQPVIFVWFFGFPRKINYPTRTRSFYDGTAFFSSPHSPTPPRKRNDFRRKCRCAGVAVNEFYAWTGLGSLSLDGRRP